MVPDIRQLRCRSVPGADDLQDTPEQADLQDTPEQAELRARVRAFLGARLPPRRPSEHLQIMGAGSDDLETGRRFLATLAEGGMAVPRWPADLGGMGATADEAAIVAEELERVEGADLYPFMVGIGLVGPTLMEHGTADQLARWLPGIRSGDQIWCQLFSEPDAGSDLANLATRAERDGDEWRVSGSKVWSSRAHYSHWGLLLARTDPSVAKHAGITAFALDMHAPGVTVRPLRQMNGDTHFSEVFMDAVAVPEADRIGAQGAGWKVAITTLAHERASIGAGWGSVSPDQLGGLARAHGALVEPVTRARVARAVADLEVARMSNLRAKVAARSGREPGPEGSGAKLRSSGVLQRLSNLALDVEGLAGLVGVDDWQTLFLTGPSLGIRGGTDEIQRNIIGERVLGLPPEPRVDKDRPFSESRRAGTDR
jgi:alkylation response protein AidB-like acyl-CoA dehydrogenase